MGSVAAGYVALEIGADIVSPSVTTWMEDNLVGALGKPRVAGDPEGT